MDFDIDAVLDQLEKTLNQSDHEENETNQLVQTSPLPFNSKQSVDELLLLDLDPLGSTQNSNGPDDQDKLERLKQDLQGLYASAATTTLPDIIGQQEELSSTSLPFAVEQLELEVRHEILQHTLEQPASSSSDVTDLSNGQHDEKEDQSLSSAVEEKEAENLSSEPVIESSVSSNPIFRNEPDLIQHETPVNVLHSVDSIVNGPMTADFQDFIAPSLPITSTELVESPSTVVFTACDDDDDDEEPIHSTPEDLTVDLPTSSSPASLSPATTTTIDVTPTQDFDLVKNILSEIFDKPGEEILDESPIQQKDCEIIDTEQQETLPSPPPRITTGDDDFRFLDEMLASIDVSDADIYQLPPASIDRVDSLLKQIVDAQQAEASATGYSEPSESLPPPPPLELPSSSSESSFEGTAPSGATASAVCIDEELTRVEQEWAKLTEDEKRLGSVAPEWLSDNLAPVCMKCAARFSITRRRHHCRACGKVFCSTCCWQKVKLIHDDSKEDRACNDCINTINQVEYLWTYMRNNQKPRSSVLRKRTGMKFVLNVRWMLIVG